MKKLLLTLTIVCLMVGMGTYANASLTFYEPFNYTFDSLSAGSLSNWTTHGGTSGQVSTMNILGDVWADTSLAYVGLSTTSNSGSRVFSAAAFSEDIHRCFPPVSLGNLYCSFLVKCTVAPTAQDYFFHFNDGSQFTFNFRDRVYAIPTTAGFVTFGLSWGSAVQISGATTLFALNSTHLIVIKMSMIDTTSNPLGNDTGYIWVDPPAASLGVSEPTPYGQVTSTGGQVISLDSGANDITIRNGSANTHGTFEIDEIRVGTTWVDVTPNVNAYTGVPVELSDFKAESSAVIRKE